MIISINGMIVVEKIIPFQLLELLEPTQISSHNQALLAHDIIILLRKQIGDQRETRLETAHQRIYHDLEHPSYVELPVSSRLMGGTQDGEM